MPHTFPEQIFIVAQTSNCCRLNVQPVSPKWSSKNTSPERLVAQTSVDQEEEEEEEEGSRT